MVIPPLLLLFKVGLSPLDFSQLINDPILHDPICPAMPTKIPSDILNFEGDPGEDPTNYFSICDFHPILSLNTPSIFICSNAPLLEVLLSGMLIKP